MSVLQIHGTDALGDLSPPLAPSQRTPCAEHAVTKLIAVLAARTTPLIVLAVGPLTNIALAIRLAPEVRCWSLRLLS